MFKSLDLCAIELLEVQREVRASRRFLGISCKGMI